jgi:hypothetical protein
VESNNASRRYQSDLEEFGPFGFEIQKSAGRPTEYALLNEQQSTLLLTYMRNSELVRYRRSASAVSTSASMI